MGSLISIIVATHKRSHFPLDSGYLPLQVGRAISSLELGCHGDDLGDSISHLNRCFCELTGLYWLWKNHRSNIYGLVHYRRYFKPIGEEVLVGDQSVASSYDLSTVLEHYDVILPSPRNYWIDTVRTHYENAHNASDLRVLELLLAEKYPEYSADFLRVMERHSISLYNMFVMRSDDFLAYCDWLFSILFEMQNRIPYKSYGDYQGRVFGFLAERLLNVWVEKNILRSRIKYLPVVNLEGENLIKKSVGLLGRKFIGLKQT